MKLFDEFEPSSPKQWKQQIQFELAGLDYDETLVTNIGNFNIKPFYTKQDVDYNNIQNIHTPNWQKLTPNPSLLQYANALYTSNLQHLKSQQQPIYFNANANPKILDQNNTNIDFLLFDLFGLLENQGNWWQNNQANSYQKVQELLQSKYQSCILADGSLYQNAGANQTQQLAFTLLKINEYCTEFGAENTLNKLQVKLAIGSHYFFEIAKTRAMRYLLRLLANTYGLNDIEPPIIAESSLRNKTQQDKENNLIRSTIETAAAIQGKANAILVHEYDTSQTPQNKNFAQELAVKQQLILEQESYFATYSDTVSGAYFIDFLTQQLAEKAWQMFKEYESMGGYLNALQQHKIQQAIAQSAKTEQELFATKQLILVGVNQYTTNNKAKPTPTATNPQKVLFPTIVAKRLEDLM